MNSNKELVELKKQLKKEKAKNGMPLKKKIIYGGAIGGAAVGAAVAIGLSVGKDDYKDHVVFDNAQRYDDAQLVNGKTQELIDFNFDNKILAGDQIMKATPFANWGTSERLVKVDNDEVKASFDGNPNVYTYYFADTVPKTTTHAGSPLPSLSQAFDVPVSSSSPDTPDEKGITHANGEVETPNLDVSNPKYKGKIPADYDLTGGRYGDTKIVNGIGSFEQKNGILHKVSFDAATGKVLSIEDSSGKKATATQLRTVKPVLSIQKVDIMNEVGEVTNRSVSYSEAAQEMESAIDQLGTIRGVTSTYDQFRNQFGSDLDIYATNIAGILDIPSYIKLTVDKSAGDSYLHYKLSFDNKVLPGLTETFNFKHKVILYQQPGGAMKVLDDASKWFNAHQATKEWNGEYDKPELSETLGFEQIDLTNSGLASINLDDFTKLTGITKKDMNLGLYLKQLPSLKIEYKVITPLYEDGQTHIEIRPKFKTYYSKVLPKPISINVIGITQAVVEEEQKRINAKQETFDLKVDELKLEAQQGKELSPTLIKYYGLEGLIDPRFTYKISHPEANSDGTLKMKLEVSKNGINSKVSPSEMNLDVRGIDNAQELAAEQTYFNNLKPSLQVSDVEYPATADKKLSQVDADALGLSHKLNLLKYEYHLTNTIVTASGFHPMTISVTPLAKQGIHVQPKPFQMDFKGISEAKDVAKEQARVNVLTGIKATINEVNLPEAKDAQLTSALATKLGLTSAIKPGYTYTYTHQGINSDTTLDIFIQVAKAGTTYKATPAAIKDEVTGIDKAIAIAGQAKEQEDVNKLASQTYTRKVDALLDHANVETKLKDDAAFAALGLTHRVKPGYIYYLDSPEVKDDGTIDYKITVMILKGTVADVSIGASKTVAPAPIHFDVSGITAANDLKDEQTRINGLMAKKPKATLTAKDLKYATIKDTNPVEFEAYDGPLTQLISNTLNLGIILDPKFSYNIKYAEATSDESSFNVTITVSLAGTTNFVLKDDLASATNPINLTGITAVSEALGLDKEQNIVNGLARKLIELQVDEDSYAATDKEPLSAEVMAALVKDGYKDESSKYDYVITNPEMTSDGEMECSILLHVKGETADPTIAPVPVTITVRGIEDHKMAKEQTRVNGASASYDVPDADLAGLELATIKTSKLTFLGVTGQPLTTEIIDKYGIKVGGTKLVMAPQYKYTYSFTDIDGDGDKELTIKVTGASTFDSKALSTSAATPFVFKISGFDRALKEKNLAIEQDRLNNLPAFATSTIVKEIQLAAGSGELTDAAKAKLFSKADTSDDTKTVVDDVKVTHLGLNNTLYTYTYSNPKINSDGDLEITIIATAKDGAKQLVTPSPFKIKVEGINAAVIQYINDIIIGTMSSKTVETSIDEVSFAGIDASTKADPTEDALKQLSLSFDKTTLDNMLKGLTGIDAGILKTATDAIAAAGQVVGLSTWLENAKKQAVTDGHSKFNVFYELHPCDASGKDIAGATSLDADGYMLFTLHFNVDGQSPVEKTARIHVAGITLENRRVTLAKEQSRINALTGQTGNIPETSLDLITEASKTELTDALVTKYDLKGADGKALVLDKTMTYYIWTDSDDHNKLIKNGDLHVTIKVLDKADPTLEVHDKSKTIVAPAAFLDHIDGISEQRAIVTQTDAQNEINALASGYYNMPVDQLDLPKVGTAVQLKTKADFAHYGIDFDPAASSKSKTLGIDFPRDGYHYELTTDKDLNVDGELALTITAVIVNGGVRTMPAVSPVVIKTQVTGINAAKALKAEQERVNTECAAAKATFNWDQAEYASVDKQPLTQAILKELGLSLTLNGAYLYTYSIPTAQKATGDMDVEIFVNATGKTQYGTAETFKVHVTGIDEYKVLQAAVADIQKEADLSKTTPITYGVDALQIDKVDEEELTQDLVTKYGLNINLDTTKFTYTYTIANDVTSDTGFTIDVNISNAGPIKSSGATTISFNMMADGIDSAKLVHTDLGSIKTTEADLKVTQPEAGTVSDGYNTNEYVAGDILTEEQIVALTKDKLGTINPDLTVFSHTNASGAAWSYTVLSKTGSTLTIEVSATKGNYTEVNPITLNGFINGTNTNNFDYPTEEITKDLASIAGRTHTTAVTLPVSAHTDEPLTQQWIDYLNLGIVLDSRFDYTFSNALTASGDMDVTVKVVRKVNPDSALAISQVIKVAVTPPSASFDKVFTVNSFAHEALASSTALHGLPLEVIKYVDGITDQFRGFSATYTLGKMDHGTNAVEPLVITLTSVDDPSNVYTFKVYMIVGDSSLAKDEAKDLLDKKEAIDGTTVIPTVISEPTRVPDDVLKQVTDALKAIKTANAIVSASSFRQIAAGTPLSETLLDELNIDTHIGSAIGLIGEEFTVASDKELTSNGDIVLTVTPVDGSGSFDITVSVTGIDAYKTIKDDLDGLSQIYAVEPRNENEWTTNEYVPWTTKLSEDTLQRLTAHNEWTQAAIDETKDEVIRKIDPSTGIVRSVVIKSKTDTELVIEITDTLNGVSYSKEVTLNGFVAGTESNDLQYLHEIVQKGIDDFSKLDIKSEIDGEGVIQIDNNQLTQEVLDYYKLTFDLVPGAKYTYSIDKTLKADGIITFSVSVKFADGREITGTNTIDVTFKTPTQKEPLFLPDISMFRGTGLTQAQLPKTFVDYVTGGLSNAGSYAYGDFKLTETDDTTGTISFTLTNVISGAVKPVIINYVTAKPLADATPEVKAKEIYYTPGKTITQAQANSILPASASLKDLPAGQAYQITLSQSGTDVDVLVEVLDGTDLIKRYTTKVTGITLINPLKADISKTGSLDKFTSDISKSAWRLQKNWFGPDALNPASASAAVIKSGITWQQLSDMVTVRFSPDHQDYNMVSIGDMSKSKWDSGWVDYAKNIPSSAGWEHDIFYGRLSQTDHRVQINNEVAKHYGIYPMDSSSHREKHPTSFFDERKYAWATAGSSKQGKGQVLSGDPLSASMVHTTSVLLLGSSKWTHIIDDAKVQEYLQALGKLLKGDDLSAWGITHETDIAKITSFLNSQNGGSHNGKVVLSLLGGKAPVVPTPGPVEHLFTAPFKAIPLDPAEGILEEESKQSTNKVVVKAFKKQVSQRADDAKAPTWLLKALGVSLRPFEELSYTMDPITSNGDQTVLLKLKTQDGTIHNYSIKLTIEGYDEFNIETKDVQADIDGLESSYKVKPRVVDSFSTLQYNLGDVLTPDELFKLTTFDEWTQEQLDQTVKDAIFPIDPSLGATRVVTVVSKTESTMTIKISDIYQGSAYSREVTLTGFEKGTPGLKNDLGYTHDKLQSALNALSQAPISVPNLVSDGIPKVADQELSPEIIALLGIKGLPKGEYLYSTNKALKATGDVEVTIKAVYASGDSIESTLTISVGYQNAPADYPLVITDLGPLKAAAPTIPEYLREKIVGSLSNKDDYKFENVKVEETDATTGFIEFDLVNTKTGGVRTHRVPYFNPPKVLTGSTDKENREYFFLPGHVIPATKLAWLIPVGFKFPELKDPYRREVTIVKKDGKGYLHVVEFNGNKVAATYDMEVDGVKFTDISEMKVYNAGGTTAFEAPKSAWRLQKNWFGPDALNPASASAAVIKAGITWQQLSDMVSVRFSPDHPDYNMVTVGDISKSKWDSGWVDYSKNIPSSAGWEHDIFYGRMVQGDHRIQINNEVAKHYGIYPMDSPQHSEKHPTSFLDERKYAWATAGTSKQGKGQVLSGEPLSASMVHTTSVMLLGADKWHKIIDDAKVQEYLQALGKLLKGDDPSAWGIKEVTTQAEKEAFIKTQEGKKHGSLTILNLLDDTLETSIGAQKADGLLTDSSYKAFPLPPVTSPASPAPSADEPSPITVDTITIDVKEPASTAPAPVADETGDEPTQGIIPQDDYPIDSPSTSFFAWTINNIYKNN